MSQESEKLSRREFLKAGLAAGAFLAELSIPKAARAQLERLLATQEFVAERFEGTIARLRKSVWDEKNEVLWVHVKKGSKEGALNILESSTETGAQGIDLTPLYEDKDVSRVYAVHTHPASIYSVDPAFPKEIAARIKKERKSNFPLLPSGGDIAEYAADKVRLGEKGITRELKHFVVEPSGLWSYEVNLEHQAMKNAVRGLDLDTLADMYAASPALRMVLGNDLDEQQKKIYREGGISARNFEELNTWAKKEWGITFSYQPFQ